MAPLEIEVKFHIADIPVLRQRILDLGAAGDGCVFETNATYDDSTQSLKARGMLLRLRRSQNHHTLTLKAPPPSGSTEYKVMTELESSVSEPDAVDGLLKALGYRIWRRYEKWRETYTLDNVVFCLDSLPFGDCLEIEGPGARIRSVAEHLGLNWSKRILISYYSMFDIIRTRMALPFEDITFDQFRGIDVDLSVYARLMEAG